MALAEAGYPDVRVIWWDLPEINGWTGPAVAASSAPLEVRWRAFAVADTAPACWPCYSRPEFVDANDCTHNPLTSPWPEVVR